MKNLAQRNRVNLFGQILLFILIHYSLVFLLLLALTFCLDGAVIFSAVLILLWELWHTPKFIKNIIELKRAIKTINKTPEYYLEVFGDNIKIHALDGDYLIKFSDIQRLNYSYERMVCLSHYIIEYTHPFVTFKFNSNSKKKDSYYSDYTMEGDFYKSYLVKKKTKHGIIFITTKSHFFFLPEIKNVEECFNELKQITNYTSKYTEEAKKLDDFIDEMYFQISESTSSRNDLTYDEQKFLSLVDLVTGSYIPDINEVIKYLEELNAESYVNKIKETKADIDRSDLKNKAKQKEFEIQLANNMKTLNEEEPFYEKYLLPFAREHLAEHIKKCENKKSTSKSKN